MEDNPEDDSEDSGSIPYVTIAQMTRQVRDFIAEGPGFDNVWANDWSPGFYRALARLGFIAVAHEGPGGVGNVLLPQLQFSYAVLDWPDPAMDRGVRRISETGRLERERIRIEVHSDPAVVLEQMAQVWGEKS